MSNANLAEITRDKMIEKETFTAFPNDFLEALCMIRIPGEAMKMLLVIARKTFGFGKEADSISTKRFMELTGLSKPAVHKARSKLRDMGIITVTQKVNSQVRHYSIQRDYVLWQPLPKKDTVRKGTEGLPKKDTGVTQKVYGCNPKGIHHPIKKILKRKLSKESRVTSGKKKGMSDLGKEEGKRQSAKGKVQKAGVFESQLKIIFKKWVGAKHSVDGNGTLRATLQQHKELTDAMRVAYKKALKRGVSFEQVFEALENYIWVMGNQEKCWWGYVWSLTDFLGRKEAIPKLLDEARPRWNYAKNEFRGEMDKNRKDNMKKIRQREAEEKEEEKKEKEHRQKYLLDYLSYSFEKEDLIKKERPEIYKAFLEGFRYEEHCEDENEQAEDRHYNLASHMRFEYSDLKHLQFMDFEDWDAARNQKETLTTNSTNSTKQIQGT